MRPQHITAENVVLAELRPRIAGGTSMRPQHITAENAQAIEDRRLHRLTSMRPQHITAENVLGGDLGADRDLGLQ